MIPVGSSDRFMLMRAIGSGLIGNGCVGDAFSPGTLLGGTGRSSMPKTGLPFRRSKMNINPILPMWTTAGMRAPRWTTVTRVGADAES